MIIKHFYTNGIIDRKFSDDEDIPRVDKELQAQISSVEAEQHT